jgi:hypothetical protein
MKKLEIFIEGLTDVEIAEALAEATRQISNGVEDERAHGPGWMYFFSTDEIGGAVSTES